MSDSLRGGAEEDSISKALVRKLTSFAESSGNLIDDKEYIYSLALKDPVTISARGTPDVLTKYRNPAFITRVTSRSADFTEIFFGNPDERQRKLMEGAVEYLISSGKELLTMDKQMGLHPEHRHLCRTMVTSDYARLLLMWDKLIFDVSEDLKGKEPEQVLIMIPEWGEVAGNFGLDPRVILVDADNRVTFVLGSDYFGEVKKGHLRMAMYHEKKLFREGRGGGLGVHAGGKVIRAFDYTKNKLADKGALFFGLSGTGKTTLSVHHFWLDSKLGETVIIRQDDFFVLTPDGRAYGTEDNAYIKTEGLEPEGQPLLYRGAISPNAVLENVYVDPETREVDFFRYDHPFVPGGKCFNGRGIVVRRELDFTDDSVDLESVDLIFFITRRETVVPPVARLNREQSAAFFMLGESILTSAADPVRAGESVREVGTNPFIVGSRGIEGDIFYEILKRNPRIQCYLLNTGGFGGRNLERARWKLDSDEVRERIEKYLECARSDEEGKKVPVTLRDGSTVELKIQSVKYELEFQGNRRRTREEIRTLLEDIDAGRVSGSDVEVCEILSLAGEKIKIQDSAAIIREIARGRIEWQKDTFWGYEVPVSVPGIDLARFDPDRYYPPEELKAMNLKLLSERKSWLSSFKDLDEAIVEAIG